ncbi:MAG: TIGR00159 family protein [Ruminococcaceae bacterium]|nr:TIGR00159 family protein [Oscillospiraceae bacterium]
MDENVMFSWSYFVEQMRSITVLDILDILLVATLLYFVYAFIRDRRAGKLAAGVALLVAIMLLSSLAGLSAMSFIMTNLFQVGFVALVVVFQPELRSALEKVGGEPLKGLRNIGENKEAQGAVAPNIKELCRAVDQLSRDRTGALIVLERSTKLGDIIKSGVTVNADLTSFMIRNVFYNGAPLHDGAMIVRGWRIYAAGCFLPLSSNESIIKDLGTRHRAGIGISEESDAVVIIVSEETGTVSMAIGGQFKRGYTYSSLRRELEKLFVEPQTTKGMPRILPYINKKNPKQDSDRT